MKTLRIILQVLLLTLFSFANAQVNSYEASSSDLIEVYYFHFERRCETCVTVEKVTEESIKKNFPDQLKEKTIIFSSINLDDESNNDLAKRLKVAGQSLLIVKGSNTKDLTNKAFMYAVDQPEKLENAIKEAINTI
jgi:hypothetical protein